MKKPAQQDGQQSWRVAADSYGASANGGGFPGVE